VHAGQQRGSGAVIDAGGLIATCSHVLDGGQPWVLFADGRRFAGEVLFDHPQADLALLRIEVTVPLPALQLAPPPPRGGQVIALGMAGGDAPHWAIGRVLLQSISLPSTGDHPGVADIAYYRRAVVHSATGAGGDSGGPLLDAEGRMVAITVALGEERPLAVAISVAALSAALPVLVTLRDGDALRRAMLGPSRTALAPLLAPAWPRDRDEEVELVLEGLVAYARAVAPERSAEIDRVATAVRHQARRWEFGHHDRRVFAATWTAFMHPLALRDPLVWP
jgi:S1-C subfamily serine protease